LTEPAESFDATTLLATLPDEPGVYRMLDAGGNVLYVGKAKNLKKRVSSYFQKTTQSPRIALMLRQVAQVDITATRSEAEALILENTLIKRLAPKYNILFRDDKSYPYISLSADAIPRLAFHRGGFERQVRYFGPYPNGQAVREALQLLQRTFLLRTCENAVFAHRSRPCLLHQIHLCKAPCVGEVSAEAYAEDVRSAELFLRGRHGEVVERLSAAMQAAAEALNFEEAARLRDQLRAVQVVLHRQYVSSTGDEHADILGAVRQAGSLCVNLAMVRAGQHLGDHAHFPQGEGAWAATETEDEEEVQEGLLAFIEQHYLTHPIPSRLIVGCEIAEACLPLFEAANQRINVGPPRNAMERAWLEMAENNARLAIEARHHASRHGRARLDALATALRLEMPPQRIECFDISHTQGEGTVASCVVCIDGSMRTGEYRRFNITGVTAGDDYGAMRQVLTRRYEKVASGEAVAPDLIVIDGGRGQLGVARDVLAELGLAHLASIGVAKGEGRRPGLETLLIGDPLESVQLPASHAALHLIQTVRDEAHRFAVAGHRARRAKPRSRSRLEDVPGIGPQRRRRLLAAFGGLQGVMAATVEDLCRVEGISRKLAEAIHDALH
jgi:excinuclease ABC subunit C